MKAPVDYPHNAAQLLAKRHGDELMLLCQLDQEAPVPNLSLDVDNTRADKPSLNRQDIIAFDLPCVFDAPINNHGFTPLKLAQMHALPATALHAINQAATRRQSSDIEQLNR